MRGEEERQGPGEPGAQARASERRGLEVEGHTQAATRTQDARPHGKNVRPSFVLVLERGGGGGAVFVVVSWACSEGMARDFFVLGERHEYSDTRIYFTFRVAGVEEKCQHGCPTR